MAYFETSYGDKIKVVPGFRDLFIERKKWLHEMADHVLMLKSTDFGNEDRTEVYNPISLKGYSARLGRIAEMGGFLKAAGYTQPFRRMLDIGTGYGLQPMLLRGIGVAEYAAGIEHIKREGAVSPSILRRRHRELKLKGRFLDYLYRRAATNPNFPINSAFNRAVRKFGSPKYWGFEGRGCAIADDYLYNVRLKQEPKLDNYIIEDFFGHEEKYDLITAFSALLLFPFEKTIAKISELLEEGGVLCVDDPYWWNPSPAFRFQGDFPWAAQRLDKEDYLRYIAEFHPEELELYKLAFEYFPMPQPTIKSYIDIGEKYGLQLLGVNRYIPHGWHPERGPSGLALQQMEIVDMDEILHNIGRFRSDVCLDDLLTSYILIALVKMPKTKTLEDMQAQKAGILEKIPTSEQGTLFNLIKRFMVRNFMGSRGQRWGSRPYT